MTVKYPLSPVVWASSQYQRCRLTGIGIPVLKIRRSHDRLIFNMGIPYITKTVFILREDPCSLSQATQTGDWPMYMQWDGSSYKYVVLPDASTPPAAESARGPLQQVPLTSHILMTTPQQRVITSQPIMRGKVNSWTTGPSRPGNPFRNEKDMHLKW